MEQAKIRLAGCDGTLKALHEAEIGTQSVLDVSDDDDDGLYRHIQRIMLTSMQDDDHPLSASLGSGSLSASFRMSASQAEVGHQSFGSRS